jgi:hypothetical protein
VIKDNGNYEVLSLKNFSFPLKADALIANIYREFQHRKTMQHSLPERAMQGRYLVG